MKQKRYWLRGGIIGIVILIFAMVIVVKIYPIASIFLVPLLLVNPAIVLGGNVSLIQTIIGYLIFPLVGSIMGLIISGTKGRSVWLRWICSLIFVILVIILMRWRWMGIF